MRHRQGMVMFFIRLAFWLGVAVMLLPTDAQQQARIYNTAVTAVERASTFCERNPRACEMGSQAWTSFLKKAEFGARLVGDLLASGGRQAGPDATPAPSRHKGNAAATDGRQGTLSAADLQLPWRGPTASPTGT